MQGVESGSDSLEFRVKDVDGVIHRSHQRPHWKTKILPPNARQLLERDVHVLHLGVFQSVKRFYDRN